MAGAVLWTGRPTAAFALVASKALAETALAIADALVGTFGVVVGLVSAVSSVSPSECKRALAEGAIRTAPGLMARALIVRATNSVARTKTWTIRSDRRDCEGGSEGGYTTRLHLHRLN